MCRRGWLLDKSGDVSIFIYYGHAESAGIFHLLYKADCIRICIRDVLVIGINDPITKGNEYLTFVYQIAAKPNRMSLSLRFLLNYKMSV